MKSFQAVILAAILAAATADNEPVGSPTFFKQELAEYEHRLRKLQSMSSYDRGVPATSPPNAPVPRPPTPPPGGVSSLLLYLSFATSAAAAATSLAALVCTDSLPWPHRQFFLTVILTPSLSTVSLSLFYFYRATPTTPTLHR